MRLLAWCLLLLAAGPGVEPGSVVEWNVRDYGAVGNKTTIDTGAIQKAIDACAAGGGGTVLFPPGDYLSGTLALRSRVTLHLSAGATLWGSRNYADFNPPHLLYANGAEFIGIEGRGTINGQGDSYWEANFKPRRDRPSPLIELVNCRDVQIRDVAIRNAPAWTIRPLRCDRVTIRGVSIINHRYGHNTDGIDPDSSKNVIISDSYIEAGDDCIVLKTTGEGACENVAVTNCVLISSGSALKLGTESRGNFRHCVFSNCTIRHSRTGIALFAKDGGTMEGIQFSSITMETHPKFDKGVEWPIVIDIERRRRDSRLSTIRDVSLSDIRIFTKGRIIVTGMPERPLERITFRNVSMRILGFENLKGVSKLHGGSYEPIPGAPEYATVPAAIILAHAEDVGLRDVRVAWDVLEGAQDRHVLHAEGVSRLRIDGFTGAPAIAGSKFPVISLKDATSVFVTGSTAGPGTDVFLKLNGVSRSQIRLESNDFASARQIIEQ